jgi:uncharacterized protein YllA (UPF0747 family)
MQGIITVVLVGESTIESKPPKLVRVNGNFGSILIEFIDRINKSHEDIEYEDLFIVVNSDSRILNDENIIHIDDIDYMNEKTIKKILLKLHRDQTC